MIQPDFTVTPCGNLFVLRDDLVTGGTKYRGLLTLLKTIPEHRILYAGTIMGHGSLALAMACRATGKTAEIYLSSGGNDHPMLRKLENAGAIIHRMEPAPITDLYKIVQARCNKTAASLPPGFATPAFEEALIDAVKSFDVFSYSELWTTSVTGTLGRALQIAFPDKIFRTVSVAKSTPAEFMAPEKYHQGAHTPPPYPACPHTDAKLWQFAQKYARTGALLWNTAG